MKSKFFIILIILFPFVIQAQYPSFTERFTNNSNLYEYNFSIEEGKAKDGYVVPYYPSDSWLYKWGDIVYTNGKIYITWADQRDDGNYHIYLAKLNANDLSHSWASNYLVDVVSSLGYRPDIAVYDSHAIYISYAVQTGGMWRLYSQRIDDSGGNPVKVWSNPLRVDTVGDDAHYWVEKIESVVSTNTNLYLAVVWNVIGSGDRGYAYGIPANGTNVLWRVESPYWLGGAGNNPPGFPRGCDIEFALTNIYITAQGWWWSPSREFGIYVNRLSLKTGNRQWNGNNGIDIDSRGTNSGYYPEAAVPIIKDNQGYLYIAGADRRDGDYDIFLQKIDITNGNHPAGWATDKKVNITTYGEQLFPDIALKNSTKNIYIIWKDTTTSQIKFMEYKSDGSGQNFGSDVILSGPSLYSYHPKIASDESDNVYVAWLEYNAPFYYIKIAKYNSSGVLQAGPTNVIKVNYMVKSHCSSVQIPFNPPAISVRSAKLTNLISSTNGGGIEIYFSHNGGNTWMPATNDKIINFFGPGWDFRYKIVFTSDGFQRPEIDEFTINAIEYYTGDLLYSHSSNTNFSGENVIEKLASYQQITNYVLANGINKVVNYIRLKNTGNYKTNFYFYGYGGDTYWTIKYYDGANDITSFVTSWTGYLITNLPPSGFKTIKVEITPKNTATEGMEKIIYISSYVGRSEGLHDSVRIKTVAWKYKPDLLLKKSDGNWLGNNTNEYPNISIQKIWTNANSFIQNFEEISTNYLLIQNDGLSNDNIRLSAVTNVSNGSISHWQIIITNFSTSSKIIPPVNLNINASSSNKIGVLVRPLYSANQNEKITFNFEINSLKTIPSNDPLRMDKAEISVTSIKVEPDAIISDSLAFTNIIGENIYFWTNTSYTQTMLLKTVPNRAINFYVKIKNNGAMPDIINVKADKLPNNNWQNSYNDGNDITSQITNINGVNYSLSPGGYKVITCTYTPDTNVPSGQFLNLKITAKSLTKNYTIDSVYLRPYNKKLRPDLIISTNDITYYGINYYTTNGTGQSFYKRLEIETEETQNYYVKIINKSPTDPDTIFYKGSGSDNYWKIEYFDTNNINITSSVTNGTNISLQTNKSIKIRVKVKPLAICPPDNLKIINFKIYSIEVPSQMDVALFSNIGVQLKPDLIIENFGNDMYRDNNYTDQTKSVNSISGVSNSYIIKIQNDGGSIESFKLHSILSNYGGSLTNWVVKFLTNNIDVSSYITNSGLLFKNLSPGATKEVKVISYPKFYGISSTNSAVGNKLFIKLNSYSTTKTNRRDLGTLYCEIKRGFPEIYLSDGNVGRGRVDTTFNETNKFILGVILNYPRSTTVWLKNEGIYTDSFNYFVKVSNNDPSKWNFSFTNIANSENITSSVTNSNIGFSFTNSAGYLKAIKFTIVATQGAVGDQIYFYNNLKTSSEKIRLDRIWFIGQIVEGLPDVAVSNLQNNKMFGWGQGATNDYLNSKIEENETNQFVIFLHNEATGTNSADFIFKEYERSGAISAIQYLTNDVLIPYSVVSQGITYSIPAGSYKTIKLKILNTGVNSSDTTVLKYRLNLSGYPDVYDEFVLNSIRVKPDVYIGFMNTTLSSQTFYLPKGAGTNFYVIITNQDIVKESFKIKATKGDENYKIRYYECKESSTNEITGQITNYYLTGELGAGESFILKVKVSTTNTLIGVDYKIINLEASPLKNESKKENIKAKILIVEAVPDLSALNSQGQKIGDGKYATNEYITEKIKASQTNLYRIYIENDISADRGPVYMIIKEIASSNKNKFNIKYFDSGLNDITYEITNGGKEYYLSAGGQTYIFMRVIAMSNTPSGEKCFAKLKLYMKHQPENYDEFSITNIMVNPIGNLRVASILEQIWNFDSYYEDSMNFKTLRNVGVTFYIGIRNEDVVKERFKIKGDAGKDLWTVNYYDEFDNDITSEVISGNYITKEIESSNFYRIRGFVIPSPSALPGDSITLNISGSPLQDLDKKDSVKVNISIECTYVKGKVIDKTTGKPITNANIQIKDGYGIITYGKSDSAGNFAVPIYPQYNVKIEAKADAEGYVGQIKTFISKISETNYVNFELVPLRLTEDKLDIRIFPHPIKKGEGGNFVYSVPQAGEVKFMIFDVYGKLLKTLVNEYKERGVYYVIWDGSSDDGTVLDRGIYLYVIETKVGKSVRKLFIK